MTAPGLISSRLGSHHQAEFGRQGEADKFVQLFATIIQISMSLFHHRQPGCVGRSSSSVTDEQHEIVYCTKVLINREVTF